MKFTIAHTNPRKYTVTDLGYGLAGVISEWANRMLASYLSINSHLTFTSEDENNIIERLSDIDVFKAYNTKTVCDFFLYFTNSNTTTATNATSAVISKTGATLRWDFGDGNVYSQNNLPAEINNGVITVTSSDGFNSVTAFSLYYCTFTGGLFDVAYYMPSLTSLNVGGNTFTGEVPPLPTTLTTACNLIANNFTSVALNLTNYTNLTNFQIYGNVNMTGSIISTNAASKITYFNCSNTAITHLSLASFGQAMNVLDCSDCELPTTDLDALFLSLNTYFTAHPPTQDCLIQMDKIYNGYVTGGLNNANYLGLVAAWAGASHTLTCNFNHVASFDKGKVVFTFDDVPMSIYNLGLPLFNSRGITGTVYMTVDYIDKFLGGYSEYGMGWDELLALQSAGWTVGNHGYTHTQFGNLTEAQIITQAESAIAGFVANGLNVPHQFCYPSGNHSATSKSVLSKYFNSARVVDQSYAVGVRSDPYTMPVFCIDGEILDRVPTFAEIKKIIDYANLYKVGIVFLTHQIVDGTPTTLYQIPLSLLTQVIDYIQTLDMDIVNMDELEALVNTVPDVIEDGDTVALYDIRDEDLITKNTSNLTTIVWDKMVGNSTLGTEEATGVTVSHGIYIITATQANHFFTGCAVGNTFVAAGGITLDANNKVRRYSGNHLGQSNTGFAATWSALGLTFDGVDNFMKTAIIADFVKPEFIYFVIKQITWNDGDVIIDGRTNSTGIMGQSGSTPNIVAYAGRTSTANANMAVDTWSIVRLRFANDTTNSKLQINNTSAITGNFIHTFDYNMTGLTLGALADAPGTGAGGYFSNILVKEIICRKTSESSADEEEIYNYLANKYGLALI